jgi:hypothetical protein
VLSGIPREIRTGSVWSIAILADADDAELIVARIITRIVRNRTQPLSSGNLTMAGEHNSLKGFE